MPLPKKSELLRLGLREAEHALAILPPAVFLEDFDALEPFEDVAFRLDFTTAFETAVL